MKKNDKLLVPIINKYGIVVLNDKSFNFFIKDNDKTSIIVFSFPDCRPCKDLEPFLGIINLKLQQRIKIGKINMDENPVTTKKQHISKVPIIKIFKEGKELYSTKDIFPKTFDMIYILKTLKYF